MLELSQQKYQLFEKILQMTQWQLLNFMQQYLIKKQYINIISTKKYLIAEGKKVFPVGLVAHLDTVFKGQPTDIFYDRIKNIMWSPQGLGADDRAGVFSIIQIIEQGYQPSIILLTDEEIGGMGAWQLINDYHKCPFDLKYLIEIDRRGCNNFTTYDYNNSEFDKYIENFGLIKENGTFSDISILNPYWGLPALNIGCGYYNEHSYQEYLNITELIATQKRVQLMLADAARAPRYSSNAKVEYSPLSDKTCIICEKSDITEQVVFEQGVYLPVCKECRDTLGIEKCPQCHEFFWSDKNQLYCDKCGKEEFKF